MGSCLGKAALSPAPGELLLPPSVTEDNPHQTVEGRGARLPAPPLSLCLFCFCLSGTESFGLFSCLVNGEEREQTHRAVFRYSFSPSLLATLHLSLQTLWDTGGHNPTVPAPAPVTSYL